MAIYVQVLPAITLTCTQKLNPPPFATLAQPLITSLAHDALFVPQFQFARITHCVSGAIAERTFNSLETDLAATLPTRLTTSHPPTPQSPPAGYQTSTRPLQQQQ